MPSFTCDSCYKTTGSLHQENPDDQMLCDRCFFRRKKIEVLENINAGILKNNIYMEEIIEIKRKKLKNDDYRIEKAIEVDISRKADSERMRALQLLDFKKRWNGVLSENELEFLNENTTNLKKPKT